MRRLLQRAALTIGTGLAALGVTACTSYYDDYYLPLTEIGSGGSGGTGGTTTLDPGCVPSGKGASVDSECGVFVSSSKGKNTNDGSKYQPFAKIADALAASKGKPVYLCGETFGEAVELTAGALIYGGLDCSAEWIYDSGKRSVIAGVAGQIPLRVAAKVSAELYDVDIVAADASAPGGSSIALLAESGADVMLTRGEVRAGNGAAGVEGAAFGEDATSGGDGLPGNDACSMDVGGILVGGGSVKNTCAADESVSGAGGIGQEASGGAGSPGLPDGALNAGIGEGAMACTTGTVGDTGNDGTDGAGASGLGTLSSEGFSGVAGSDGQPGKVGQGGGGGGGAKGGAGNGVGANKKQCGAVAGALGNAGASGGSGGAAGCGGAGGKGGGAGGASIGIVALGATFTFASVTIAAHDGGKGGNGGDGQAGGSGGLGAPGGKVSPMATDLKPGCTGGPGGKGGAGGRGGGGLGGPSIGLAFTGAAPSLDGAQVAVGSAGKGGTGAGADGAGQPAVAEKLQGF